MNKKKLIDTIKNEIQASVYYDNETYFGSILEAKDLLAKLENGKFDSIFRTSNIDLVRLSKWNRSIDWSHTDLPTLRDYRLFAFIDEINEKILELNEKNISSSKKVSELNKLSGFLNRLKSGIYDDVLDSGDFWFGDCIAFEAFLAWDSARMNSQNPAAITHTNYIVFAIYHELMDHINRVNTWKDIFGYNYSTRYSRHVQSPTTEDEMREYESLAEMVVEANYDWREAREVVRYFHGFNVYEDAEFPHNVCDVMKIFSAPVHTVFPQYEDDKDCCRNTEVVAARAKELAEWLTPENLVELFLNRDESPVDSYLRRMIVSQFDCKLLKYPKMSDRIFNIMRETVVNYSDTRADKYDAVLENIIRDMFENPNNYLEDELRDLFKFKDDTLQVLYNIAHGTLYSMYAYPKGCSVQIYSVAVNLQKQLGCWNGTVGYNDFNTVNLPNGKRIYSISYEDIEKRYGKFQDEYEFYCKHSSSDFEYIEGCTEIVGNVVLSQIFREGNKRTSKCLFNALLMSRGIVPPIMDFNKNGTKTWLDFAYNRNNMYMPVKEQILRETVEIAEYFDKFEMQGGTPNF